jgi:hypothetical protein
MLDEDLDADMGAAFRKVSLLTARVVDDQLREEVKLAVESAAKVSVAVDERSAIDQFSVAMDGGTSLMERIGDSLRKQY